MKSYTIPASDGNVDIDFRHAGADNPLVNAIEVINKSVPAPTADANDTVSRRTFTGTSAQAPQSVSTSGTAWSQARGAVMIDGKLYTGWADGTFRVRTFNGTTFGAANNVDLNGLTEFANELPNITGMFFERSTGRLYYTLAGRAQLYYRYFTPQSGIVGAVRYNGPGNTAGVDWRNTSGLVLVNGTLYVGSSVDGNLRKVAWSNGQPVGSLSSPVSGPATGDGNDYRTRALFLFAG
jgi:hypothetical protein